MHRFAIDNLDTPRDCTRFHHDVRIELAILDNRNYQNPREEKSPPDPGYKESLILSVTRSNKRGNDSEQYEEQPELEILQARRGWRHLDSDNLRSRFQTSQHFKRPWLVISDFLEKAAPIIHTANWSSLATRVVNSNDSVLFPNPGSKGRSLSMIGMGVEDCFHCQIFSFDIGDYTG